MHIILGVTGGIAAYKAVHILRGLREAGHEVTVIPTAAALKFVGAATWEALAGHAVHTKVWDGTERTDHVALGRRADLVVVAPATADFLARFAHGRADDLLTATLLMAKAPVVLSPAMHSEMWLNVATMRNIATLEADGHHILTPATGRLAGSDSGIGRLPEPDQIIDFALGVAAASCTGGSKTPRSDDRSEFLTGRRVVISAGGTQEPIDPVRFLGNRSSGRQGVELARAARSAGARVVLVAANVHPEVARDFDGEIQTVTTADELHQRMLAHAHSADVLIMAAAVADFRPEVDAAVKIKKNGSGINLKLVENPDILADLVQRRQPGQIIVGFAAETGDQTHTPLDFGQAKALRKRADLLAINEVGASRGFGEVPNAVTVVDASGEVVDSTAGSKSEVARALIGIIDQWGKAHLTDTAHH